ncbi:MAG: hypothetical protein ACRDY0_02680 [Acidimicrobiales bacterium]
MTASFPVSVDDAYLTWFSIPGTTVNLGLDQAIVYVDVTTAIGTGSDGGNVTTHPLDPSRIHLVLPDGTQIAALPAFGAVVPNLASGTYEFLVPATLTDTSLVIDPGTGIAAVDTSADGTQTSLTVSFAHPVTLAVDFPTPTAPAATTGHRGTGADPEGGGPPDRAPPRRRHHHLVAVGGRRRGDSRRRRRRGRVGCRPAPRSARPAGHHPCCPGPRRRGRRARRPARPNADRRAPDPARRPRLGVTAPPATTRGGPAGGVAAGGPGPRSP